MGTQTAAAGAATPAQASDGHITGYASTGYRSYVLNALLIIYILSFMDRALLSVVARPLKAEIAHFRFCFGLLTGAGFAVFYTIVGIPLARLSETQEPRLDHRHQPRHLVGVHCADRAFRRHRHRRNGRPVGVHGAAHLPRRRRHRRGRLHAAGQFADRRLLSGRQAFLGAGLLRHGRHARHHAGQHCRRPDHRRVRLALGLHRHGPSGHRDRDPVRDDGEGAAARLLRTAGRQEAAEGRPLAVVQGDVLQDVRSGR